MKKIFSLMLTVALLAAMTVGCGRNQNKNEDNTQNPSPAPEIGSMESLSGQIMGAKPVQFMGGNVPLDLTDTSEDNLEALKSYTGLADMSKIKDLAVYEPMMGSMAFSLVLVRVTDGAQAKTVAQEMYDNINPRKWVCVSADQKLAAGRGDVVMFIMLDSNLGLTAQDYVDAFKSACGGVLDFTL